MKKVTTSSIGGLYRLHGGVDERESSSGLGVDTLGPSENKFDDDACVVQGSYRDDSRSHLEWDFVLDGYPVCDESA